MEQITKGMIGTFETKDLGPKSISGVVVDVVFNETSGKFLYKVLSAKDGMTYSFKSLTLLEERDFSQKVANILSDIYHKKEDINFIEKKVRELHEDIHTVELEISNFRKKLIEQNDIDKRMSKKISIFEVRDFFVRAMEQGKIPINPTEEVAIRILSSNYYFMRVNIRYTRKLACYVRGGYASYVVESEASSNTASFQSNVVEGNTIVYVDEKTSTDALHDYMKDLKRYHRVLLEGGAEDIEESISIQDDEKRNLYYVSEQHFLWEKQDTMETFIEEIEKIMISNED